MRLPVIKPITYLSPSSFSMAQECMNKFYNFRLAGYPYFPISMNAAACCGVYFDAIIKDYIAKKRGMKSQNLVLGNMTRGMTPEEGVNIPEIKKIARNLAKEYIEAGFVRKFLSAKEVTLNAELYKFLGGVPMLGILDATIDGVVFDWKLRGWPNKTASPYRSYRKRYSSTGKELYSNDDYKSIELCNYKWACQMLWYTWLLGDDDRRYRIHEICRRSNGWELCVHEGLISKKFSDDIRKKVEEVWDNINGLYCDVDDPIPSVRLCESFGKVCDVHDKCSAYCNTLGGDNREDYV